MISDVFSVRRDPTAEASLAAMRDRSKLGIAIAAIMRMIATTINNSISEKPLDFRKVQPSLFVRAVLQQIGGQFDLLAKYRGIKEKHDPIPDRLT